MSRYGYTREEQDNAAKAYIKEWRRAAGLLPALRSVFNAFDGKVYNCRLEKALQAKIDGVRVYCNKHHTYIEIYIYGGAGIGQITLAQIRTEDLQDGKRIPATKLTESAIQRREELLKRAAALEAAIPQIETVRSQIKAIQGQLDAILKPLDYTARDIYSLNYRMINY